MLFEIDDINWFNKPLTLANSARLKWFDYIKETNKNVRSSMQLSPVQPVQSLLVFNKNTTINVNNNNNDNINNTKNSNNNNDDDIYKANVKEMNITPLMASFTSTTNVITPLSYNNINNKLYSKYLINNNNNNNLNDEQKPDVQIDYDLYNIYRQKVIKALHKHKFFSVYGSYPSVRQSLLQRGWVEKLVQLSNEIQEIQNLPITEMLKMASIDNKYEMVLLSKIASRYNTNFIWQGKINPDKGADMLPYRNRIRRLKWLNFTTKEGLIGCIEQSHWYTIDGISEINVPRYHNLTITDEMIEFEQDYRTTYCLSLLNYIHNINDINILFDLNGQISVDIFTFACDHITNEIKFRKHIDIDTDYELLNENNDKNYNNNNNKDVDEWNNFYSKVNRLVNGIDKFRTPLDFLKHHCLIQSKMLIKEAAEYWPTISSDGYNNIWILKPAALCRGRGIIIKKELTDIRHELKHTEIPYIIQKYIEKPLLIYKTKFDIRQYMLVTITESILSIWMYKNCYLRFSSQEYQLSNLNESIHLTNHAIQKKYQIGERSDKIPSYNMWSLNEFKQYLIKNNNENVWDNIIYSGMKKNIIAIVLSSLEEFEFIPNTFELYGCDFMIDENYKPLLLEINSSPDLSHTTPVTSTICPEVLEDVIKVVIDLTQKPNCCTGNFELIYSVNCEKPDKNNIQSVLKFELSGKRMKIHKGEPISYNDILRRRIKQNKQFDYIQQNHKIRKKKMKKPKSDKKY